MKTTLRMSVQIVSLLILSLNSGCAELASLNKAITNKTAAITNNSASLNMPPMSSAQQEQMHSHFQAHFGSGLQQAVEEARPTIEKTLQISACYPNYDIEKYLQPYTSGGGVIIGAPMAAMQYHPKTQCLSVVRLDSWKMLARNAFSFRAVFVSDASGESRSLYYNMIKEPDGAWLLN
ncbi:hypothetical protein GMSM_15040 [Geomonas sp. Red276]